MDKQFFLDRVAKSRKDFLSRYSYDLLPASFKGVDKIVVECRRHGAFTISAYQHLYGHGCSACGFEDNGLSKRLGTDAFIRKSKQKFGEKFDYSKTSYVKKGVLLTITCPIHGDINLTPEWHTWSKHGCRKCDVEIPREIKKNKAIERATSLNSGKYDYSKVVFTKLDSAVEIVCPRHGSFFQNFFRHSVMGDQCPKCVIENGRLTFDSFIERSKKLHGDVYDYSKSIFSQVSDKITITCKEHGDFIQRVSSHLAGNKCRLCYLEDSRLGKEKFIASARKVHGDVYDYSKVVYRGSKEKVEILCPIHGSFWQKPNTHTSSKNGCSFCYESRGERALALVLKKFKLDHIREYRIPPRLFRYDFCIPEIKILIEFNGIQHYRPVEFFGGQYEFERTRERDEEKKIIAKVNGYSLVTVTYKSLHNDTVENDLIVSLKRIYKYWLTIDGVVRVFKRELDLYRFFRIEKSVLVKEVLSEVLRRNPSVEVLF